MKNILNGETIIVCWFEGENLFMANKERRNEESKGNEEKHNHKIH